MAAKYSFITRWQIRAPIEKVWDAIYHSEQWPKWWRGVATVNILNDGDIDGIGSVREYTWKAKLGYSLRFTLRMIEIEKYKRMKAIAFGELDGIGEWFFEEKDGITFVQYNWDVKTTLPWMNRLAFILRPFFMNFHNLVMGWGGKGLAKRLDAHLIAS